MQDQLVYQSEFQFYFLPEKKLYCVFYKWLVEKNGLYRIKLSSRDPVSNKQVAVDYCSYRIAREGDNGNVCVSVLQHR